MVGFEGYKYRPRLAKWDEWVNTNLCRVAGLRVWGSQGCKSIGNYSRAQGKCFCIIRVHVPNN